MSKILYECRSDTHAQWSLNRNDLHRTAITEKFGFDEIKKLKFKSYKAMVDHMSSVMSAISYLQNRNKIVQGLKGASNSRRWNDA